MTYWGKFGVGFLALIFFWWTSSAESEPRDQAVDFIPPKSIQPVIPDYPVSEQRNQNAGLVHIQMMVDKQGRSANPVVLQSTSEEFEENALKALSSYEFTPATLDGVPVEGIYEATINFLMGNEEDGVSHKFRTLYKRARKELDKPEPRRAYIEKKLEILRNENNLSTYALAFLSALEYRFALRFLDTSEQLKAIERVLLFEKQAGRLPADLASVARSQLFILYANSNRFSEALQVYAKIVENDGTANAKQFASVVAEIKEFYFDSSAYVTNLELNNSGYRVFKLFKRTLSFTDVEGDLNQLKLRCRNKYSELDIEPDTQYQIPKSWGYCSVQVIGAPNTSFSLVQL